MLRDVFLASKDLSAACDIYVSRDVCVDGKMIVQRESTCRSASVPSVGHSLSVDFIFPSVLTIGVDVLVVIGRDVYTGFILKASSKNKKSEPVLACLMTFLSYLTTFGHERASMVFDNEVGRVSVRIPLGHEGMEAVYLPSGPHNKRVAMAI